MTQGPDQQRYNEAVDATVINLLARRQQAAAALRNISPAGAQDGAEQETGGLVRYAIREMASDPRYVELVAWQADLLQEAMENPGVTRPNPDDPIPA